MNELLLEAHLLLREILIGGNKLCVKVRIHTSVILTPKLNSGWCENWLRARIHLKRPVRVVTALITLGEISAHSSLRDVLAVHMVLFVRVSVLVDGKVLVKLGWRSGCRKRWGLGCSSQSCEQMRTTGPWSRVKIGLLGLVDGRDVAGRSYTKAFNMRSLSTGGEPRARHAEAVGKRVVVVVGHLSEAASV